MSRTLTPIERFAAILQEIAAATSEHQAAVIRRDGDAERLAREKCHALLDAQLDAGAEVVMTAIRGG